MVAAVAARVGRRIEVHPVVQVAAAHAIAAVAHALATQPEAALQAVEVDAAGSVEVQLRLILQLVHRTPPNPTDRHTKSSQQDSTIPTPKRYRKFHASAGLARGWLRTSPRRRGWPERSRSAARGRLAP